MEKRLTDMEKRIVEQLSSRVDHVDESLRKITGDIEMIHEEIVDLRDYRDRGSISDDSRDHTPPPSETAPPVSPSKNPQGDGEAAWSHPPAQPPQGEQQGQRPYNRDGEWNNRWQDNPGYRGRGRGRGAYRGYNWRGRGGYYHNYNNGGYRKPWYNHDNNYGYDYEGYHGGYMPPPGPDQQHGPPPQFVGSSSQPAQYPNPQPPHHAYAAPAPSSAPMPPPPPPSHAESSASHTHSKRQRHSEHEPHGRTPRSVRPRESYYDDAGSERGERHSESRHRRAQEEVSRFTTPMPEANSRSEDSVSLCGSSD
ncbi:hypothetical protein FA95DRAFT_215386 [Auriscalpium vulgare]|uniref:Uncharacterized protein n=1 Tax=Auriscalpium vulgare TaxID=40419 RepID=A0ACB8RLS2_9AGAM|nr:hypothetical protein FA95DRAFT_215386 [Auriscalpium vulgare]